MCILSVKWDTISYFCSAFLKKGLMKSTVLENLAQKILLISTLGKLKHLLTLHKHSIHVQLWTKCTFGQWKISQIKRKKKKNSNWTWHHYEHYWVYFLRWQMSPDRPAAREHAHRHAFRDRCRKITDVMVSSHNWFGMKTKQKHTDDRRLINESMKGCSACPTLGSTMKWNFLCPLGASNCREKRNRYTQV